jgi:hypothetical protein
VPAMAAAPPAAMMPMMVMVPAMMLKAGGGVGARAGGGGCGSLKGAGSGWGDGGGEAEHGQKKDEQGFFHIGLDLLVSVISHVIARKSQIFQKIFIFLFYPAPAESAEVWSLTESIFSASFFHEQVAPAQRAVCRRRVIDA